MIRTSISIDGKRLSENDFSSLRLDQKVSGHHSFEIHLNQKIEVKILLEKTKSWIGKSVTIGFDHHLDVDIEALPVQDVFTGIVTKIELSRQNREGKLVVKGYSPTIAMDDGPSTLSFSNAQLEEIVSSVMKPYDRVFPSAPKIEPKTSSAIDYSVQYKESNFDYVNRLANRYGEWFYYDGLHMQFGRRSTKDKVIDLDFDENGLMSFDMNVSALPTKIKLNAYDYTTSKFLTEESPDSFKSDDISNEAFKASKISVFTETPSLHIQTHMSESNLKEFVTRREEISADETLIVRGESKNHRLKPAAEIKIEDTYLGEEYGNFYVTAVNHYISQGGNYTNYFEGVPVKMDLSPVVLQVEPPFCETQLATVVDTDDPDALGRVKVEFFWQKAKSLVSPWIRVATPYVGIDKGFYVIPEIEDQVLVAFENNNPDKPYVLTGFYNKDAKPEWFDPENRFKGFKSKGKNEWKFDDKNQKIEIKAVNEILMHAGNKITLKTNGKDSSEIFLDVGDGTINLTAKKVNVVAADLIDLSSGNEFNVTSGTNMTMSIGQNTVLNSGKNLDIQSGQNTSITAGNNLETAAMKIKSKANVTSEISAKKIDIKADVLVSVKGKAIKLN